MRRVTYSRNFTISLSRTCRCYCKYCAFATHQPHLRTPDEVERLLDDAQKRRAKELLILTGEAPDQNEKVMAQLNALGHKDFIDYVVWTCERSLERGILPHTNLGVMERGDMERLREVTASQGLMLESISERLMETVHAGSPTKHPKERLRTIALAGELQVPYTTGILVGIGETPDERIASLRAIAQLHEQHGHIQEVILQNFVPHPRYHGQDVGEIASDAADDLWRTGMAPGGERPDDERLPDWACSVSIEDMKELVLATREMMPDVGIQIPPNLADWWPELVEAGATDLGGLSANGDHISPEHPFPSPAQVRDRLAGDGVALAERLCVYPQYTNEQWVAPAVMDTIIQRYWSFIPRGERRRAQRPELADAAFVSEAVSAAGEGVALTEEQLTALFSETREDLIEEIREAADGLRESLVGDDVSFIVNRNINFTNVCTVGCAFCGFGQSRRSPDAYEADEADFREKIAAAVEFGATELCMQGGIHPDYELEDYGRWLRIATDAAPQLHLHAYSPMEIANMVDRSGRSTDAVFRYLSDLGLGSTPGTAAEVLDDDVRGRISPNKLPAARWVEIVEAAHAAGVPTTSTVMFGHIEEPWELARHMRVLRELQERSLANAPVAITEFVPLSFIPYQTLLGRTHGIAEITREENLKHTAVFRLALGRTVPNVQASWVKMGLDTATEALRWGVNDLGGTLMEESISRAAGSLHGSRLDPVDLVAAGHAAGRPVFQRNTLYTSRLAEYPLPLAVQAA
ncbi:MAG: 5-amino-6-(D-ribitylamino)uracil--L-tyrosine 4-hydroxyphenyl transferase CofH [Thermoleophilaceae bacterium]|nr:5-amino-6-(D-ribitylamino)uracil--L-tyrosine 4-hydroxyphenyl transferase CofH [Thermoleophilaceae bacterium]